MTTALILISLFLASAAVSSMLAYALYIFLRLAPLAATAAMALFCAAVVIVACTHLKAGDLRATTFGSGKITVETKNATAIVESDGTNLADVIGGIVRAARDFFTGGGPGDVIVNVPPAAGTAAPAEPTPAP